MPVRDRLRPYQEIHCAHARKLLSRGQSCLISAFTAFGKTFTGLAIIEDVAPRTLWLADTTELTSQNAEEAARAAIPLAKPTFINLRRKLKKRAARDGETLDDTSYRFLRRVGPDAHGYAGGLECRTYAWIATQLRNKGFSWLRGRWDILVCDEADLAMAPKFSEAILAVSAKLLGLTATPFRTDKQPLAALFGTLIRLEPPELASIGLRGEERARCMTVVDGISLGWLVDCLSYRIVFEEGGQREPYVNTEDHRRKTWEQWELKAKDRITIVVLDNIEAADDFAATGCAMFGPDHCRAVHMRSTSTLEDFKQGRFQAAATVAMAYRGINHPPVSALLFLCETKSLPRQFQFLGRGLRLSPDTGKEDCIILVASSKSYRDLDLTLFDSIQGPMEEPETLTEGGGGLEPQEPDELPSLSNIIARMEQIRLWRQRVAACRTLPWVVVDGAAAIPFSFAGDRFVVVELCAWSSSRCIVREIWWETTWLTGMYVVATNVEEPTAFALAEQFLSGLPLLLEAPEADVRKAVRRWWSMSGPPKQSVVEELGRLEIKVPRTHGEAVLELRRWHATSHREPPHWMH